MKFNFTPPRFSKWVVVSALVLASFGACKKYDDSELWKRIESLEKNDSEIKQAENNVNNDIKALNQLISTLETGNYITSVITLEDGSGYMITFAEGEPILIKNGTDGEKGDPGAAGEDGVAPVISVAQCDGVYY